ncbi:2OG-Fe(II) oxygenase [Shewanella algae]|uniref:2OG-Fe(II) oxygenase n=1 Tax=Shewanella algae TaxID=38313 RepID=UPI001182C54D|nr:2OG-Fe(II) oxygenase [Shewanella algae]TVL07958.1 proline hydroxylase [Shewanella algae]
MVSLLNDELLDRIADALTDKGYIVLEDVLPETLSSALLDKVNHSPVESFRWAEIGRGNERVREQEIRSDRIRWLNEAQQPDADYLEYMACLRHGLNRRLFMGLFDYESHYAFYRPGTFYRKHLDALRGSRNRILTTVFFLNPDWQLGDGGELMLYEEDDALLEQIPPRMGTLVIFLSERFPHEVLPTHKDRASIAGWFRVAGSYELL